MSEYVLQKRTLSSWSYVTWYEDLEQAKLNYQRASKADNGYSWRLVELTVLDQKLLDGSRQHQDDSDTLTSHQFISPKPAGEFKSDWGTPGAAWGTKLTQEAPIKPDHGLTGSVWVGNPVTKEKRRVPAAEATKMLNEGWIKTGPRTVL